MDTTPDIALVPARSASQLAVARQLFEEYAQQLGLDLGFQGFQQELEALPGDYEPPRGELLLATVDGTPAGCCALRPLANSDHVDAAEMKRLYVLPIFRGFGIGRQLARQVLDVARTQGYRSVLLDTLDDMQAARALYAELGFREIAPYYHNPLPGACYLKAEL